jgi:hypothetical protein
MGYLSRLAQRVVLELPATYAECAVFVGSQETDSRPNRLTFCSREAGPNTEEQGYVINHSFGKDPGTSVNPVEQYLPWCWEWLTGPHLKLQTPSRNECYRSSDSCEHWFSPVILLCRLGDAFLRFLQNLAEFRRAHRLVLLVYVRR